MGYVVRECRLIRTITHLDGRDEEVILYRGCQGTHMQRLLDNILSRGQKARIECDPPDKRKVRINPLTGKPRSFRNKPRHQ